MNEVKHRAAQGGRELDVYTVGMVTCFPTKRQAEKYHRHQVTEQADWSAQATVRRSKPSPSSPECGGRRGETPEFTGGQTRTVKTPASETPAVTGIQTCAFAGAVRRHNRARQ